MKKILLALGFAAILATPAVAHEPRGHHPGFHHHHPRYDTPRDYPLRLENGFFLGLGDVVIGAGNRRYYEPRRYRAPRLWCETIETRDPYGYLESRRTVCHNR